MGGVGMGIGVTTIVVEPRFIVRAALASLMGSLTYRVVCSVGTTADIISASIGGDGCKLAILGALSAEDAANEAVNVRKLWPDCKILLLLESASPADFQKLMTSQIDGCVPLYVSAEILSRTLDLIIVQELRVMVAGGTKIHLLQGRQEDANKPQQSGGQIPASVIGGEAISS